MIYAIFNVRGPKYIIRTTFSSPLMFDVFYFGSLFFQFYPCLKNPNQLIFDKNEIALNKNLKIKGEQCRLHKNQDKTLHSWK